MIEDAKGREQVFVHAQGRMDMRVRGSSFETIGGNREQRIGSHRSPPEVGNFNQFVASDINVYVRRSHYHKIFSNSWQPAGGGVYEYVGRRGCVSAATSRASCRRPSTRMTTS